MDKSLSLGTRALLVPRRAGLRDGQDNVVEVLLRVQAPDAPAGHAAARPPQAVALVIDRSGSMDGRPLEEARRCAAYVASKLRPTDHVSVVQFDQHVQRLLPAQPLGDGSLVRQAVAGIAARGSTNLHAGWAEGVESLSGLPDVGLRRVILLSDGCANQGLVDPAEIAAQCARSAGQGISTSTYGLGRRFNEDLMVAMAQQGTGGHYYGDTAEDLMEPFEQEFDLLANLCLVKLGVELHAADGVSVEMLNDLPRRGDVWSLPDLAWGAEAWAMLRLTVPKTSLPASGRQLPLLRVLVRGESLVGAPVEVERTGLSLPVLSRGEFDALSDDELVSRRLVELAAAQALDRMRDAAAHADWVAVERILADARKQFAGHEWLDGMLQGMDEIAHSRERDRMLKEALYASKKLHNRLVSRLEERGLDADPETHAYLRRKRMQGKGDR